MSDFEFGLLYSFRNPPRWHAPWAQVYDQHIRHIVEMEQAGFDTIWGSPSTISATTATCRRWRR